MNIVEIRNIVIDYKLKKYSLRAVDNVDFDIAAGKITALVGESGSGKTTIASSLLNCISSPGQIVSGSVTFKDGEREIRVESLDENSLNAFRWEKISMVFQGAQSALNPVVTIFNQFYETMLVHENYKPKDSRVKITKEAAEKRVRYLLDFVNLDADRVMAAYPHELSGGMKQRVMIAFSLLLDPSLIILDEPTTALDVITQDFIFRLLRKINRETGVAMLLLTHDISVVAKYADYVGVMYGGRLMEYGAVEDVFRDKLHPYTRGLINSTPAINKDVSLLKPIGGEPPNLLDMPSGCKFHPRCPYCREECKTIEPETFSKENGHKIKCFLYSDGEDKCRI
ncbi:MAG: ABC transporter ATP-binding protein [Clostridia bacterium]|nr:ABC transporter ATP-binding protein [Clostridia bacterium]